MQAAFLLAAQDNGYDLLRAIATVSRLPAHAAGLHDRGDIRVGLRADVLQARLQEGRAVIQQVWRQANRVF